MIVNQRRMPVRVTMRLDRRIIWRMFVLMVRIVAVDVFVLKF